MTGTLDHRFQVLVGNSQLEIALARARALEKAGYRVKAVTTLAEVRESISAASSRGSGCDVIVLDGRWVETWGRERAVTLQSSQEASLAALREAAPEAAWLVTSPAELLPIVVNLLRYGVAEILLEPIADITLQEAVARVVERVWEQREGLRLRALVPLYQISQAFMTDLHLDELLQRIVETAVAATGAQRGSLMLIDEDRQELTIQAAVGMPPEVMATARERVGRGIAGWVARTGVPLVINNEGDIPPFLRSSLRGGIAHSAVCLPLAVKGKIIGVINLTKTVGQPPFTRGDAELLSVLAGQAAIAIENARLFEAMERAYQDLRRLDEMKSEFINVAAHELRTPVAVVLGYAALLAEEMSRQGVLTLDEKWASEYIEPIIRSARRLQELADNLLNLEHLSHGRPSTSEIDLAPLPACSIVQRVAAEFQPLAQERGISLEVSTPCRSTEASTGSRSLLADEAKTILILRHLLSNALKFTPSGGHVVLSIEPSEEEVVIAVADTGPGVPPEKRRYLFQPFFQVEPSLTRRHPGLGVGLSIAKRLAELQNGRLWLEDRPGFGAVFCLALPRA
ncbi:MAG: HAMP domain-containing sensor histidine kinase [Anaerolineae bacterium]|nr:HAMP domain-containing histidine kinase [Anaerolineae bacterium]MDW8098848.1 HAMP domain-containing sensor histidine kinase [Anaerolineae bacterium]